MALCLVSHGLKSRRSAFSPRHFLRSLVIGQSIYRIPTFPQRPTGYLYNTVSMIFNNAWGHFFRLPHLTATFLALASLLQPLLSNTMTTAALP